MHGALHRTRMIGASHTLPWTPLRAVVAVAAALVAVAALQIAVAQGGPGWTLIDVAPLPVACEGAPGTSCPLVRPLGSSGWRAWDGGVEGFEPIDGHAYRVLVRGADAAGPLLVAAVLEDVPLGDVEWRIHAATAADERLEFGRERDPALRFDLVSGRMAGTAGCNQLSAPFATGVGRQIVIGPIVSTLMMCPDDVMRQEQAVVQTLEGALTYALDGEHLRLQGAGGSLWLSPVLPSRQSAAGRAWPDPELASVDARVAEAANAGAAWAFDPLRVALEWLPTMPESAVVDVTRRDTQIEFAPYSVVSVSVGGLLDDSVAALRDVLVLERMESGHWRIVAVTEAQRCARGDHVGWLGLPDLCP
jgi:hypothetical protein